MLLVVADQIVQSEAVVRRDEVDTCIGTAAAVFVQVVAAGEPCGELRHRAGVAAPEPADGIAILPVPLGPQHRKIADLITPLPEIPGLRNQLHLRQHGILMDDVEKRPQSVHVEQFPGEGARQVESKPVDVHLDHPVPQAVHDQLQHLRALHVQRVPAAGEIHVVPQIVGDEPVVRVIVDTFERQRRSEMIAFGRMVVDDVQNDFESGGVERAHHPLEFTHPTSR